MKIFYISPSRLPSRSANSIHVIRMCEAFSSLGHDVFLYANRTVKKDDNLKTELEKYYGASLDRVRLFSFYSPFSRWMNLQIAIYSIFKIFIESIGNDKPDLIVSRNPYASVFLCLLPKLKIINEIHQVEDGIRKIIQKLVMKNKSIVNVVISEALLSILIEIHRIKPSNALVLHDAAVDGIEPPFPENKQKIRSDVLDGDFSGYEKIAGYFGHLYDGRGLHIIQGLAERMPDIAFAVFGGNDEQIVNLRNHNRYENLKIMGYIEPGKVQDAMGSMDLLLMPYQETVSIGGGKFSDTGKYMSPMKMFEYLASGVPLISSRLQVLEEVLEHERNCLLAGCDNIEEWCSCVERLLNDGSLYQSVSKNARFDYKNNYTWKIRAQKMTAGMYCE